MSEPSRLSQPPPASLTAEQRTVYEEILRSRGTGDTQRFRIVGDDGALLGPFGPMVAHPAVGRPLQDLGARLRYAGALPPRTREVVICTVAAARGSEFEWYAHSAVARSVGVSEGALQELLRGQSPGELDDAERVGRRLALALLAGQAISDDLFTTARRHLGIDGVVEVVALVGYYRLLADLMKVFRLDAAPQ